MTKNIHTTIDIEASPDAVWGVLVDLERYEDWNPFVTTASGRVVVGDRLVNQIQSPAGKGMTIKPTVTEVEQERVFEWLGHLGVRGIFDGRHRFELEPLPSGGTRLVHSEQFGGVASGLLLRFIRDDTVAGFEAMNVAIKERVEAAA